MSRKAKMVLDKEFQIAPIDKRIYGSFIAVSYTHLRAHET